MSKTDLSNPSNDKWSDFGVYGRVKKVAPLCKWGQARESATKTADKKYGGKALQNDGGKALQNDGGQA